MMEFIIVFPIYLVLFGAIFAIDDMLIHSNRLASGDRVNAFDVDGWSTTSAWNFFENNVFDRNHEVDDRHVHQDRLNRHPDGFLGGTYADASGPWTVCAGSRVEDGYLLPAGGTMGQLVFADRFFDMTNPDSSGLDSQNTMLSDWERGRRVVMRSKGGNLIVDRDSDAYCYYTLKRRRNVAYGASWRDYSSGLLPYNRWKTEVAEEAWHTTATVRMRQTAHWDPTGLRDLNDYERYYRFVGWSE